MKLGLMGGTFNPIHNGHLKIASKVLSIFNLTKIIFIPSGNPPHKNRGEIIDARHRIKMIEIAIQNYTSLPRPRGGWQERFGVSDIEIKREGKSYTLDTIKQIKEIYGIPARNRPARFAAGGKAGGDTEVYFIAGADTALDLPNWKKPSEILSIAHFVAVERPRFSLKRLKEKYSKRIIVVEGMSIDISSSDIRKRIKEGTTIKNLVPGCVEKYIKENGLYI